MTEEEQRAGAATRERPPPVVARPPAPLPGPRPGRGPALPGSTGPAAASRPDRAPALPGPTGPSPHSAGRSGPAGDAGGSPVGPARLPMDPRIRERRLAVRRDEGRRRRRILLGCLGVAVAVAGAAGAVRSPLFDVDYVDVRGVEHTARPDVVAAGGLEASPALLDVDTGAVERRVEALPWVRTATARRQWPRTVRIDVVERRPAAVVPAPGGAWALADETGRVLAVGPERPAALPAVGGLPPAGEPGTRLPGEAAAALAVAAALPEELRERVADVAAVEGGEVELQLAGKGGGVVRLGRPEDLGEKFRVLATVLARADLAQLATIDLRVPRAPTLTRR